MQALRACGDVLREATRRIDISRAHRDINALEYSHELQPIPIEKIDAFDCFSEDELKENRPYNQRINLPSINDDIFEYNDNYSDGLGDIDEDELSRERVKKASCQIVQAQERKKLKSRKRH